MSTLRTSASSDSPTSSPNPVVTFLIVAGSSVCFCTKGVFAKLAYRHGLDFLTVLALRMLVALPFFVVIGWTQRVAAGPRLTRRDWFQLAGLGFLGYYLSSFANFAGLQWISVGLERVVLVSSLCSGRWLHPLNLFGLILVWKRVGERWLQEIGLRWTVVRPGGLRDSEEGLEREGVVFTGPDQQDSQSIPRRLVARVCLEALETPAAEGRILEITSRPNQPRESLARWLEAHPQPA